MRCIHVNLRTAICIVFSITMNHISLTQMADNKMDGFEKDQLKKSYEETAKLAPADTILHCPHDKKCEDLPASCLDCDLNSTCIYGQEMTAVCKAKAMVKCKDARQFEKQYICRYCYQTEVWDHSCDLKANCNSIASPRAYYATNCTVHGNILCLGHRTFNKNVRCNWTGGYRWSTALALSITLGGFGADRFYLGHWQEGIGKLFSFGGLGVWTIIDVILISLHYLGPADGSLYI